MAVLPRASERPQGDAAAPAQVNRSFEPLPIAHRGGCLCGRVRFGVDASAILDVLDCYRSICRMIVFVHQIVPGPRHQVFHVPRSHPDGIDVNLWCLDPGTVATARVTRFDDDGREAATAAITHLATDPAR